MKKKLTHNLGMKILSLFIAIVFWIGVVNREDPVEKRVFRDVPVRMINEEKVTEREKVLEVTDGDTVDVELEGRRSELEGLSVKDIQATADMAEVSFMDTVLIRVSVPNHPNITVLNDAENVMKLLFDDYVTKTFSFKVNTVGTVPEGFYVGDALPSPNIIQISGAKTVLDRVKEVSLLVDVNGRSVDFTTTAVPVVYDMNGDEISSSKLELKLESETVTVNVPVLSTKKLQVRVNAVGEVPEGYEIIEENVVFQPDTVTVAGTKEDLAKLSNLLTLEVDVTGQTGLVEKNIQVASVLDDTLTSLRVVENPVIAVTATVTPYIERSFEIPVSKIQLRNLPEGYSAALLQTLNVPVTVYAKAGRAPHISVDYLNPFVDLAGCTEGTYQLQLQLEPPAKAIWNQVILLDVFVSPKEAEIPVILPEIAPEGPGEPSLQ